MRTKLKHQLTEALQNYFVRRWSRSTKSSVLNNSASTPSPGTQHAVQNYGATSTLLHTLREVHSFCYLHAMKGKNLKGKKAKRRAAAIAAFTAGSDVHITGSYTDKISVVDMPDLVQSSIPVALNDHKVRMQIIADTNVKAEFRNDVPCRGADEDLETAILGSFTNEMERETARIALLVAALDAITGIRNTPKAEIGVKGFLVGIKRVLEMYTQEKHDQDHGKGTNDNNLKSNKTPSEIEFDSDLASGSDKGVVESPELTKSLQRLLIAIGNAPKQVDLEFGREAISHGIKGTSSEGLYAGATEASSTQKAPNAIDMILSMSLSDKSDYADKAGIVPTDTYASAITEEVEQSHLSFQMVKALAYAFELLPILKHVPIDTAVFHTAIANLLLAEERLRRTLSAESASIVSEESSVCTSGTRNMSSTTESHEKLVVKLGRGVSAAGRLFMLKPALFVDVESQVRPLALAMLEGGLHERLTDCLQIYNREVLMPAPSTVASHTHMIDCGKPAVIDLPGLRRDMRALAMELATSMSRGDLVLHLFAINTGVQETDEVSADQDNETCKEISVGTPAMQNRHYDGRSGSSGDRDTGVLGLTPQTALIACRQAHAIAGVFGLTDLKTRIQEQLKWIKIAGFASKGKWQLAYQLCSPYSSSFSPSGDGRSSNSTQARPARSSAAAAHLFNYLKLKGMFSEALMIWNQEDGFAFASNVKVVSVPASTSSGVDEDGQVMGYIPFVGSTSAHVQEHDNDTVIMDTEVTVSAVTPQQLETQSEIVRKTFLPFPYSYLPGKSSGEEAPECGGQSGIIMVDSLESLMRAEMCIFGDSDDHKKIGEEGTLSFVGIDAEWKAVIPQHGGSSFQVAGASLLQVATSKASPSEIEARASVDKGAAVFLFDLDALSAASVKGVSDYSDKDEDLGLLVEESRRVLTRLFSSLSVVKVGWDTNSGDLAMLRAAGKGAFRECFDKVNAMLDASKIVSANYRDDNQTIRPVFSKDAKKQLSLSDASSAFLGRPLHKSMQVSDWASRPLTVQQKQYAANDALVLLAIMDTLLEDYAIVSNTPDGNGDSSHHTTGIILPSISLCVPATLGVREQYIDAMKGTGDQSIRALPGLAQDAHLRQRSALHDWLMKFVFSKGR